MERRRSRCSPIYSPACRKLNLWHFRRCSRGGILGVTASMYDLGEAVLKAGLLAKLREYKSDLNNLKSELKRISAHNARQATREELLESGMADTLAVSTDQRGRLMMTTERLNQSTDRIKESRRTLLETEDLGVSILQDLHQQRQSLLHAHITLHGVDDNVGKSKKILVAMSKRMDRNKWIIGAIISALVVAILIILYFKFAR